MVTEQQVRDALRSVLDPEIGRPIEDIGMLEAIAVEGGLVRVHVLLTIEGCPLRDRITQDVTGAVQPLEGVERVEVSLTPMSQEQREALVGSSAAASPLPRRARGSRSPRRPRWWRSPPARAASASPA